jgi:monofunctional biosynthetic peptidoglycan transglycosylase
MVAAIIGLTVVLVLPLRWQNPATTMFVFNDSSVESVWVYQRWSHISDISEMMQLAVIASEDQKFPQHFGFDFVELKKALLQSGGPTRGASTITQQLVKNLYLWKGKSIFRKAIEAYMTLVVEMLLPKERILELYLNVVEFGSGVYGVEQAAAVFFDKTPQKLNRVEASLLAAVLPNPKKLLVSKPSPYVYNRALDIRFSMRALGGLGYLQRLKSDGKAGP